MSIILRFFYDTFGVEEIYFLLTGMSFSNLYVWALFYLGYGESAFEEIIQCWNRTRVMAKTGKKY